MILEQLPTHRKSIATILVVEDEPILRDLYRDILSHENRFQVHCVSDAITAKNRMISHKYDLAIIDLKLPIVSGFDLIKDIRKANIVIPIIVISAFNPQDEIRQILQYEATSYLRKPVAIGELLETIKSFLQ